MPTYDYQCAGCGGFDAYRSVAARDEPAPCPGCGAASPRVFAASAPRLACMDRDTRAAIGLNEQAAHAPRRSGDGDAGRVRLRHPAGCGCCGALSSRRGATVTAANGAKAFPSKRPWMISH